MTTLRLSSRNNAQGEWTNYIPGKTLWLVSGKLYTGTVMTSAGIDISPITDDEITSLQHYGIKIADLLAVGNAVGNAK